MENLQTQMDGETTEDNFIAQEKLQKRREARRRKILENAKNRLERLNGRTVAGAGGGTGSDGVLEETNEHMYLNGPRLIHDHHETEQFSDPDVEPDIIPQRFHTDDVVVSPLFQESNFTSIFGTAAGTSPQQQQFHQKQSQKHRHIIFRCRLHLIISALMACIFTIIWPANSTADDTILPPPPPPSSSSSWFGFSIFLPAGLCVITDLLFFREQQPINPIINIVLALYGQHLPTQTQNIIHIFSIIQSLIVDLGIFVFSFCTFSSMLTYNTIKIY